MIRHPVQPVDHRTALRLSREHIAEAADHAAQAARHASLARHYGRTSAEPRKHGWIPAKETAR